MSVSARSGDAEQGNPPPTTMAPRALSTPAPVETQFIGVVHNLTLSQQAAAAATCRCMAAAVGLPDNPAFAWQGKAPAVGDDAIVVAISNEGTPCDKPVGGRGPSIAGVEHDGVDVVVSIEEGRPGRPLARGAVVARPASDGWLVFRAGRLPYGRAADATGGVCRVRLTGAPAASAPR